MKQQKSNQFDPFKLRLAIECYARTHHVPVSQLSSKLITENVNNVQPF